MVRETKAVRPGGLGLQGPPAGVSTHIGKALLVPPQEALRGLGVKEGEVSSTQGFTELIRCGEGGWRLKWIASGKGKAGKQRRGDGISKGTRQERRVCLGKDGDANMTVTQRV